MELILIRHGQADSAGDNYDQLTATGHEQARRVGAWLATNGYRFAHFLHGGLRRQEQTLEAIRSELAKGDAGLSAWEILPGLAEFDLKVWGIVASALRHGDGGARKPEMAKAGAQHGPTEFSELLKRWNKARHENAENKGDIFKQLTGIILAEWVKQGENFTEAESFPAFQRRVLSVLEIQNRWTAMENHSPGAVAEIHSSKILAVTSGGPISLITGHVLGLDLTHTLGLMRRIYNTSIHHFVLSAGKWELVSFNTVPHLPLRERTLV